METHPAGQGGKLGQYAARLNSLRAKMAECAVQGFLVPLADEYQGEYPPASARRMEWLTGFTGSAGLVAVLEKNAAVFVDGRYTLQARQQVDATLYEQQALTQDALTEWLTKNLAPGSQLAYDPWLHTQSAVEALRKALEPHGIELVHSAQNLVDAIWQDRPAAPCAPVEVYSERYAGEPSAEKRRRVGKAIGKEGADAAIITAPDSIAWLLNVRGADVPHTPLPLSFALLHKDGRVDWFIDEAKVADGVRAHVGKDVRILPMSALPQTMRQMGRGGLKVRYDAVRSASWFSRELMNSGAQLVEGQDPCLLPKACKNAVEVEGMRQAHIRDGVALTRFLAWLDEEAMQRDVTEMEAEEKLLSFRAQQADFRDTSFDTIAGSGAHGAIVHYRATPESNKVLEWDSLFLLDSGGQYLDGTTDVTRTVAIGTPTAEQKRRFTQVLQGHIALARVVFPKGVAGRQLDVLARAALWADGVDYAHGTGHGVGAYLCVHEGPQGIHARSDVPLQPGMVLSNEPGFYKEGEYGIRIENLVVVKEVKAGDAQDSRPYYGFETLTLAPIDTRLVETALLTQAEREWLDAYHQRVYDMLSPHLDGAALAWLRDRTRPLS